MPDMKVLRKRRILVSTVGGVDLVAHRADTGEPLKRSPGGTIRRSVAGCQDRTRSRRASSLELARAFGVSTIAGQWGRGAVQGNHGVRGRGQQSSGRSRRQLGGGGYGGGASHVGDGLARALTMIPMKRSAPRRRLARCHRRSDGEREQAGGGGGEAKQPNRGSGVGRATGHPADDAASKVVVAKVPVRMDGAPELGSIPSRG